MHVRSYNKFPFLYCFLLAIICLIPYISKTSNLLESDILYHISRIDGLSKSIYSDFNFFPKIYFNLFEGKGYAFPMFYCDIFLIPAALLAKYTGVIIAYKFEILLINFFTALFTYRLLKKLGLNEIPILLGVILYVFSYYRLYNIYYRAALGELLAIMFIPIALLGIYNSIFNNEKEIVNIDLIVGFGGVALSHNISLLLLSLMYFLLIIFNFKKANFIQIGISTIITIFLVMWFFYPMIEQLRYNDLVIESVKSSSYKDSFYNFKDLLFITDNQPFLSARCGDFTILCSIFLFVIQKIRKKQMSSFQKQLFYIGFLFLLFTTKLFYPIMSVFSVIQFSSRFLIISSTMLNIFIAISFHNLLNDIVINTNMHKFIIFAYVIVFIYLLIFLRYDSLLVNFKIQSKGIYKDFRITTDEIFSESSLKYKCFSDIICLDSGIDDLYLPKKIRYKPNEDFEIFEYAHINRSSNVYSFTFNRNFSGYIEIPIVYYYGYNGNVDDKQLALEISEDGYIKTFLNVKENEVLYITYKNSTNNKVCYILSFTTFLFFIVEKHMQKILKLK